MGFFNKLIGRKKVKEPLDKDVLENTGENAEDTVSSWDFQYSQSIYDRNLTGVLFYEIETASPDGNARHGELFTGEFIEMNEGKMAFGVRTKGSVDNPFDSRDELSLSYSRYGESFYVEAKVIKATATKKEASNTYNAANNSIPQEDENEPLSAGWEHYIVKIILCSEPMRHRRSHGRVAIAWNVYYRAKPSGSDNEAHYDGSSNYSVTKTIDISEGGFKSIVENQLTKNTEMECVVEVDNHRKSEGTLIGKVIRCDYMADNIEMCEMTVQFIEMDDSVREFLVGCIVKEHPGGIDSDAIITISSDFLEASIELTTPRNNGSDLSYEALRACLASEGVTYGIDNEALKALSEKPYYNLATVIARGTLPTHGDDAELTYYVEMNPMLTPEVQEDGSVDLKDLGLIQQINKGDVLVEKKPSTEGTPGTCVTGEVSSARPGKDLALPAGVNTVINEAGTALLSGIDGGLSVVNGKINVFNTYMVESDVDYETGNINHNGIVIVRGDVRSGFTVEATGDILIDGTVESARIKAGGSLIVRGGCVGDESVIETGGSISIKFIDGGSIISGGDLQTTYIIGSTVKCGGSIDMIGSGIIRNSHVIAHININAKVIGSVHAAADKTVVEVGNDPELLNRYVSTMKKVEQLKKDIESLDTMIRALTIKKYKSEISDEKHRLLEKNKHYKDNFSMQYDELADECKVLKEQINKLGYGTICIQNTAYEGLRIIIGSSTLVLKDSVKSVKFFRNNDGITFSPLW